MNIRDLDDSKIIKDLVADVERLKERVAGLEVRDVEDTQERITTLRNAISVLWKEMEHFLGKMIEMARRPPEKTRDPLRPARDIAASMKREQVRRDGERAIGSTLR